MPRRRCRAHSVLQTPRRRPSQLLRPGRRATRQPTNTPLSQSWGQPPTARLLPTPSRRVRAAMRCLPLPRTPCLISRSSSAATPRPRHSCPLLSTCCPPTHPPRPRQGRTRTAPNSSSSSSQRHRKGRIGLLPACPRKKSRCPVSAPPSIPTLPASSAVVSSTSSSHHTHRRRPPPHPNPRPLKVPAAAAAPSGARMSMGPVRREGSGPTRTPPPIRRPMGLCRPSWLRPRAAGRGCSRSPSRHTSSSEASRAPAQPRRPTGRRQHGPRRRAIARRTIATAATMGSSTWRDQ
mmetsp:Transcript_50774/g.127404  ORF Transcript_50774/g.127404 Transcript_50774/m.127404 type:complete len:292 (-) Transcript_50774:115-990(-)